MKSFICKYCGGTDFKETTYGYECTHCHAQYELEQVDSFKKIKKKPALKKWSISITLLVVLCALFLLIIKRPKTLSVHTNSTNKQSTLASDSKYSSAQLSHPERNVRVAELSLNQEALDLAKDSVIAFGGDETDTYEKRLKKAQKQHDTFVKKRSYKAPQSDMVIENPNSEFSVMTYYRENGFFVAYGPEFNQYSDKDIERIWGTPEAIITDQQKIIDSLSIKFDQNNQPENYETKQLREQWLNGDITYREVRAMQAFITDNAHANFTKEFVYEKQGKPNVYFDENNNVGYLTPLVNYVSFSRLPETFPYVGLGKYPDDFPENYGEKGLYNEK